MTMNRRRFLNLSLKISVAGGLALSGASIAHRLLWDYDLGPGPGPGPGPGAGADRSIYNGIHNDGSSVAESPPGALGSAANADAGPGSIPANLRCLSRREYVILRAAALRILDGATPDPQTDGAARQCAFADRYLAELDGGLRSDVKSLLSLLELYPVGTGHFTRFSRLSPALQDKILSSWAVSSAALLRQALQALKALCFLAHYQDERSFASIGYSGPLVPQAGLGRVLPAP